MKWSPHYTGIETAESNFGSRLNVFLKRGRETKALDFARLSFKLRRWHMLGVFLKRLNYLSHVDGFDGWEAFTSKAHFGYVKPTSFKRRFFKIAWCGSLREPYSAVCFRVGRVGFGFHAPKLLQRWKDRREAAKWNTVMHEGENQWNGQ